MVVLAFQSLDGPRRSHSPVTAIVRFVDSDARSGVGHSRTIGVAG